MLIKPQKFCIAICIQFNKFDKQAVKQPFNGFFLNLSWIKYKRFWRQNYSRISMINMLWKRSNMMKERIAKNGIAYILQKIVGACILFWKSGLDSRNKSCIMTITEPTMPLIFMRKPVGLFHLWGVLFNRDDWNGNKIRAWWTYWRRCRNWMTVGDTFRFLLPVKWEKLPLSKCL